MRKVYWKWHNVAEEDFRILENDYICECGHPMQAHKYIKEYGYMDRVVKYRCPDGEYTEKAQGYSLHYGLELEQELLRRLRRLVKPFMLDISKATFDSTVQELSGQCGVELDSHLIAWSMSNVSSLGYRVI